MCQRGELKDEPCQQIHFHRSHDFLPNEPTAVGANPPLAEDSAGERENHAGTLAADFLHHFFPCPLIQFTGICERCPVTHYAAQEKTS